MHGVGGRIVGGMLGVARPPADVADLIHVAEVVEQEAALLFEVAVEHVAVLLGNLVARDLRLGQELLRREDALRQGLRVLGHPLGVEAVHRLGQLGREVGRRRDGRRGRHRIVIDRAHVELELRLECPQVHSADAAQMLGRHHLELDRQPVAPLSDPEHDLLVAELDLRALRVRIEVNGERRRQLHGFPQQRVVRSEQLGLDDVVVDVEFDDVAAADVPVREQLRRVEGERAVRTLDVARAHAREFAARRAGDGEVRRHADDGRAHAVLFQHFPERRAVPELLVVPAGERKLPGPHLQEAAAGGRRGGRRVRDHRLRVPVQEVEDAVPARVHARDEARPGDRAVRRDRRLQPREAAHRLEAREVRQPALVDQLPRQRVVQAVEAEHDDLRPLGRADAPAAAGNQEDGREHGRRCQAPWVHAAAPAAPRSRLAGSKTDSPSM